MFHTLSLCCRSSMYSNMLSAVQHSLCWELLTHHQEVHTLSLCYRSSRYSNMLSAVQHSLCCTIRKFHTLSLCYRSSRYSYMLSAVQHSLCWELLTHHQEVSHSFFMLQEFQVFQHALRCAAFPVLGAPDPPSGSTPSPQATPAIGTVQKR